MLFTLKTMLGIDHTHGTMHRGEKVWVGLGGGGCV